MYNMVKKSKSASTFKGTAHQSLGGFKRLRSTKEVLTQNLKNFYRVILEIIPFLGAPK